MSRCQNWYCLSLIVFAAAFGAATEHVVRRSSSHPYGWAKNIRARGNLEIPFTISLDISDSNLETAIRHLEDVSNPASESFGNYWDPSKVAKHFAPSASARENVTAWLHNSGLLTSPMRFSHDRSHISFNTTIENAERLLNCEYYYTEQRPGVPDHVFLATDQYAVPKEVSQHISFVHPTFPLGIHSRQSQGKAVDSALKLSQRGFDLDNIANCSSYTSPKCLHQLYNIPEDNLEAHPENTLGIFQTFASTWRPEDLDNFFTVLSPEHIGNRPVVKAIDGGYRKMEEINGIINLEPDLDFSYAMALNGGLPVVDLQVGEHGLFRNLNSLLAAFDKYYCGAIKPEFDIINYGEAATNNVSSDCGTLEPPKIISISWEWKESNFPKEYLHRQCLEYLKLGLQGVTVLTSSGDVGAAASQGECLDDPDGTNPGAFSPMFPASCPWVTTVGGTSPNPHKPWAGNATEEVSYRHEFAYANGTADTSGGGFSRVFDAPGYQAHERRAYLETNANRLTSVANKFDHKGRGYPDIAAMAHKFALFYKGGWHSVYGTSGSTPVVAAMLARVNNARLWAGKSPVGFINPVIYAYPEIFRDITSGHNDGCGEPRTAAFETAKGWDPVTGLGTMDFGRLMDLYMRLP